MSDIMIYGLDGRQMPGQTDPRSPSPRRRVCTGSSGYYVATVMADGSHHQPPSWCSSAWYPTERAALRAMRAMDDADDDCPEYWGGTDGAR
jgi:hypothetical protein